MSAWGKYLAQVTVPTGGWDFVWVDVTPHTVTIPAGTYASALHVGRALRTAIRAVMGHGSDTVTISSTGYTTLAITGLTAVTWASTSDDLEAFFGFTTSESVVGETITSDNQHTHCWYPGTISLGVTNGIGPGSDTEWEPQDDAIRTIAGNGAQSIISPSRLRYERVITYRAVRREERRERLSGVHAMSDHMTVPWLYYPNRDNGTVASYGTQGDPGDGDVDDDCDYWVVTLSRLPMTQEVSASPDYFDVTIRLNGEPA